jgi:hypothetical protein
MPLVIALFLSIDVTADRSRIYILHMSGVYLPKMNSSKVCLQDSRNVAIMGVKYRRGQPPRKAR